jgi:hypothetical protein
MNLDALLGSLIIGGKPRPELEERFTPELISTAITKGYISSDFMGCQITDTGKSIYNAQIAKRRQAQPKPQTLQTTENAIIPVQLIEITAPVSQETPKPPILEAILEEIEETMPKLLPKPKLTKAMVLDALEATGNTTIELGKKLGYPSMNVQAIVKKAVENGEIKRLGNGGKRDQFRYYPMATDTLEPYREAGRKAARAVIEETIVEAADIALKSFVIPQHKHPATQIPISQETFKNFPVADPEILAINQIATALHDLEPRAAARVLDWATARFIDSTLFGGQNV